MKQFLISFFLFLFVAKVSAQQYYPIFTQNYSNPFIINPSLLTLDHRAEINATYRQQWVGINDGPKTIQFDIQYPFSPRISGALNFYNDKSILLNNSGGLATFGYRVPLHINHILGFGLSAGFVSNQIDIEGVPDVDLLDPVLLNSSDNFGFDGQFGLHYQTGNFVLGFSLLKLVDNRPFSEGSVESQKFDPFKDRAAIMGYRFNLSEGVSLVPTIYYRTTYSGYEYFEGSLLVNYKETFTVGGGYRMDLGPHVMLRVRLKALQAGYSYDLPNTRYGGSTGGTHELQIKFQFGNVVQTPHILTQKDTISPTTETTARELAQGPSEEATEAHEPMQKPVTTTREKQNVEPSTAIVRIDQDNEVLSGNEPTESVVERKSDISEEEFPQDVTYDLVVGAFARKAHADRYVKQLFSEGFLATVKTSRGSALYYVVVPSYSTKAITLDRVLEIRNKTQFKDAWFKSFQ